MQNAECLLNAQFIMHNAQLRLRMVCKGALRLKLSKIRFSHTVLRTTLAAHSLELKVLLKLF